MGGAQAPLVQLMPKWVEVSETGILLRDSHGYLLSMPGGGHWRLEDIRHVRSGLLGSRVRIEGMRVEFNTISVDRIEQLGRE